MSEIPEKITLMNPATRREKVKNLKWNCTNNNLHILDQIYNYKYYQDKIKGLHEVVDAVRDEKIGIIIADFRSPEEKSEYTQSEWICIYFSKIEGKIFCVPISEGNDFLKLETIHPASMMFEKVFWTVKKGKA